VPAGAHERRFMVQRVSEVIGKTPHGLGRSINRCVRAAMPRCYSTC
jgi:hypothetical protein